MGVKRQQEASSTCTVVLVGDSRVGKTALVNRLIANKFSEVGHVFLLGFIVKPFDKVTWKVLFYTHKKGISKYLDPLCS